MKRPYVFPHSCFLALFQEWSNWEELDMAVWKTINEWMTNHWGLNFRKCVATLIINKSSSGFQVCRNALPAPADGS